MWANNHFLTPDRRPVRVPAPEDDPDIGRTPEPPPEDELTKRGELEDVFKEPPQSAIVKDEEPPIVKDEEPPIVNDEETPSSANGAMFGGTLKRRRSSDTTTPSDEEVYGMPPPRRLFNAPIRPKEEEVDDDDDDDSQTQWQDKPKDVTPCSTNADREHFLRKPFHRDLMARDRLAGYRRQDYNITTTKGSIERAELIVPAELNPDLRGATITLLAEGELVYFPWPLSPDETTLLMMKAQLILGWQTNVFADWDAVKADKRYQAQWLALGTRCLSPHLPDFKDKVYDWLYNFEASFDELDLYRGAYDTRPGGLRAGVEGEHVLYEGLVNMGSDGLPVRGTVNALYNTHLKNIEAAKRDKGKCSDPLAHPEMLGRNRYIREQEEKEMAPPPPEEEVWTGHGDPDDLYFDEVMYFGEDN